MARPPYKHVRTRREANNRAYFLVALVAAIQILLDAFAPHIGESAMFGSRLLAAAFVGVGSVAFEIHKAKRGA